MNIPITAAINKDIEPIPESFKGLCDGPEQLLNFIIKYLSLSTNLVNNFIESDETPKGDDKKLVWIKTSFPYGIGKHIDGEWQVDYSLSGYPANIPFLSLPIANLKPGLAALTVAELDAYGINSPVATATQRMYWYILRPPALT